MRFSRILLPLFLISAACMIRAASGDLWLDEIWSLNFVRELSSPLEIFNVSLDNNHLLNSLFLYGLGDQTTWILYRVPSLLSGFITLILIGRASIRKQTGDAILVTYMACFSFPLILYFSEARGYAPAILASLAAYLGIQTYENEKSKPALLFFWLACVLGFLAHLIFIQVYLALILWTAVRFKNFKQWLQCHWLPLAFLSFLYFVFIRPMHHSGGPDFQWSRLLQTTLAMATGAPETGVGFWAAALTAGALSLYAIKRLMAEKNDRWIFFVSVIVIAPVSMCLILRPEYLHFRHFVLGFSFLYLLWAYALGQIHERSKPGKIFCVLLCVLFFAGQLPRISRLMIDGRGHYKEAVEYLAGATKGPAIVIKSNHDFRNKTMLDFYARFLPPDKKINYLTQDSGEESEWYLAHKLDPAFQPPPMVWNNTRKPYALVRSWLSNGTSGWSWHLYRIQNKNG